MQTALILLQSDFGEGWCKCVWSVLCVWGIDRHWSIEIH